MKDIVDNFLALLKETFQEWSNDRAARLGAALAYYTLFSIAPLLIILLFVLGEVWGDQSTEVQALVFEQIEAQLGSEGAGVVQNLLEQADRPGAGGIWATVLGVAALLFGATGVFVHLQDALNTVWGVRLRPGQGLKGLVRTRLLSFGMILVIGLLLLVSFVLSIALAAASDWLANRAPGLDVFWRLVNIVVSFGMVTLLFAMIYRILPDVEIAWREVWIGAIITALLFTLGKFLIGLYLGRSSTASTYGAAGSLVVLLLWVYYASQIFFLGAEFTQVYARRHGSRLRPLSYAVRIVKHAEPVVDVAEAVAEREGEPTALPPASAPPSPFRRWGVLAAAFCLGWWLRRR